MEMRNRKTRQPCKGHTFLRWFSQYIQNIFCYETVKEFRRTEGKDFNEHIQNSTNVTNDGLVDLIP